LGLIVTWYKVINKTGTTKEFHRDNTSSSIASWMDAALNFVTEMTITAASIREAKAPGRGCNAR
jgi:hypothetical protein